MKKACSVITVYKALHAILNVASNREIFEHVRKELYQEQPVVAASSLTEVRWACKIEEVDTMIKKIQGDSCKP